MPPEGAPEGRLLLVESARDDVLIIRPVGADLVLTTPCSRTPTGSRAHVGDCPPPPVWFACPGSSCAAPPAVA
eukprot:4633813-Prymnesium_polylepis.2